MSAVDRPSGHRKGEPALATALAAGLTLVDAAAAAGVSERTARRRMADPQYRSAIHAVRTEIVDSTVGRLVAASVGAVDTLAELSANGNDSVRLRAAGQLLGHLVAVSEAIELRLRLDALEASITQAHALPNPD